MHSELPFFDLLHRNMPPVWILLLQFCVLITVTVASPVKEQFIKIPPAYQLFSLNETGNITASSANDCTQLINNSTTALAYFPSRGTCVSYKEIQGYNTNNNVFYLRMKGQNGKCASVQDTLKVLLNYAYGTEACPYPAYYFTFDSNTGYCSGDLRQQYKRVKDNYFSNYASYTQGVYRNFTLLVMSRGMASRALKVSCPFENSTSVTFNGQWHCYTQFPVSTPSAGYITNDVCSSWIPGGSLINFVHSAEPGLLAMKNGPVSYIGYLPSGVVPNSYAYRFANGSQIIPNNETLPWSANAPLKRSLVYWSVALELLDYNETRMNVLMCRNNAANPS